MRRVAVATLIFCVACGKSDGGTSPGTNNVGPGGRVTYTAYTGAFANLRTSGTLTVSVADTGSASGPTLAKGAIVFISGDTANVTGSFLRGSGHLELSGGGDEITGNLANGTVSGTFSEPTSSGKFAVQPPTSGGTPKLLCGTYVTSADYGWLSFVVSASGSASGFAVALVGGGSVGFNGTVTGVAFAGITSDSVSIHGTLSPDGSSITGTYTPPGAAPLSGTFQGSTAACSTAGASTNSGLWSTSGTGASTSLHFAIAETGGTFGGSGVITVGFVNGWTGNEFLITSGSVTGSQVSFTAQLGANPTGSGGFFYGTLAFTGTISGSTMTGTVVFTPPRTLTQTFAQQTVTGLTLTRN
jgi:hypothetical protein